MLSTEELYLVILFDQSQSRSSVMNLFQGNGRWVTEFVSDLSILPTLIERRIPKAFILFPTQDEAGLIAQVKYLRSTFHIDQVPIIALHAMPSHEDVVQLLTTLSGKEA